MYVIGVMHISSVGEQSLLKNQITVQRNTETANSKNESLSFAFEKPGDTERERQRGGAAGNFRIYKRLKPTSSDTRNVAISRLWRHDYFVRHFTLIFFFLFFFLFLSCLLSSLLPSSFKTTLLPHTYGRRRYTMRVYEKFDEMKTHARKKTGNKSAKKKKREKIHLRDVKILSWAYMRLCEN